jgi:CRP/FNR family transcriptional regulator, cyclic AMP receptor protein
MIEEAKKALAATKLFSSLPEAHVSRLAAFTGLETVGRGKHVFREGDPGDRFYVILDGRIRISRQIPGMGEEALAILEPGDYFGEMALIDGRPRSADALAHESARLLTLNKRDLDDLLFVDKIVAYDILWAFVRTLSARLRETDNKLTFLSVSSKFG